MKKIVILSLFALAFALPAGAATVEKAPQSISNKSIATAPPTATDKFVVAKADKKAKKAAVKKPAKAKKKAKAAKRVKKAFKPKAQMEKKSGA